MKKENSILILLMVSLLLSTGFISGEEQKNNEKAHTPTGFKSTHAASHEVEFSFAGFCALYGTPKDCGLFKPDTVTLKGVLTGNENVDRYDAVEYAGVLQISIKMAVCSVKRVNGEDQFCTMTVNANGPVNTELKIDTAAGYGYIQVHYDPSLGAFTKNVNGSCDPQEMIEEQDNLPNNSIATIFNGLEIRSLKNSPVLQAGRTYTERSANGTLTIKVIR